jgi:plasmid stability protein
VIPALYRQLKQQLRRIAAHGRSMGAGARESLKPDPGSRKPDGKEFLASIRALVEPLGGVELEPYPRGNNSPREVFAPRRTRRK